ncbi:MAG TPA: ABC transporter ATP-binding protein [Chloroflexia bacterium]|nr:ABC transporter ATP-binding protein [Chloroflexia bacterium]
MNDNRPIHAGITSVIAPEYEASVQADKLVKKYGERIAVQEVSLSLKAGEIFGLLGPNGAGKSTTIGMLSGYLTPTSGSIRINGIDFNGNTTRLKHLLGVVPQELAIYEENTCEENLYFFAEVFGLAPTVYKPRIESLLKAVGLWERRKEQVKKFSGGMKRRLNLIVALINEPLFIMMDEPTVGVDPQSRHNIYEIIQRLKAEGKIVLYTTQYMEEAEQLCDRIAIIDHGQLVAQGTLEELLANAKTQIEVEKPRGLAQLFLQLTGREFRD